MSEKKRNNNVFKVSETEWFQNLEETTKKDKLTKKWQKEIDRLKDKISKGFKERDFVKVYEYARKKEELERKIMEGC